MGRQILTCRVTVIESFRQWIESSDQEDKPWINENSVLSNIKGIETFNIKAKFGSAGHSIIEEAPRYATIGGYAVDGFTFTEHQAKPMIKFRNDHPLMTRELALSKLYHTPYFDIIITGTTDHLEGNILRDTKFKFSTYDVSDFISSFQWRCYLDMIGLDIFWYDFFKVSGFNTIEDCPSARISDCESMMVKRYPSMDADIQETINEFAQFINFKGLEQHLKITPEKYKRILRGDSSLKKIISL